MAESTTATTQQSSSSSTQRTVRVDAPNTSDGGGGKTAAIFGATGAVGQPLLAALISSPTYSRVHVFTRRPIDASVSQSAASKVEQHIVDFDKLVEEGTDGVEAKKLSAARADDVFITLGTTRKEAGSAQAFERIDREYVLSAARASLIQHKKQSVLYCSSQMADSTSRLLYTQSKGLTEEGIAAAGYDDVIIFRPAFLAKAQRTRIRPAETVFGWITSGIGRFTDAVDIPVSVLGQAMCLAGTLGTPGLLSAGVGSPPGAKFRRDTSLTSPITIVSNAEAKRLVAKDSP